MNLKFNLDKSLDENYQAFINAVNELPEQIHNICKVFQVYLKVVDKKDKANQPEQMEIQFDVVGGKKVANN